MTLQYYSDTSTYMVITNGGNIPAGCHWSPRLMDPIRKEKIMALQNFSLVISVTITIIHIKEYILEYCPLFKPHVECWHTLIKLPSNFKYKFID